MATALAGCGRVGFDAQDGGAGPVPTIGFAFAQSLTDEGVGTHAIEVVLSEPSPSMQTVTVEVSVAGGSADRDDDYALGSTRVTMLPGETRADLLITIFDDGTEESDETVELRLGAATNARVGTGDHQVTISGTLLPRVAFMTAASMAPEDTGPVELEVVLDVATDVDVVVAYAVSGTASADDHELENAMLVIPAGMTAAPIDVTIVNDGMDEFDETINVSLTAQSGAVIGAVPAHVHTIVDEDPPPSVGFTMTTSAGSEGAAGYEIRVELDAVSGKPVTVDFSATGGSAGLPADFTLGDPTLVFAPGVTQKLVPVTIVSDVLDEDDETAQISLMNATNAAIRMIAAIHTLTILDDDAPPALSFANTSAALPEGAGTINPQVVLSAPSGRAVQFSLVVAFGTATAMDVAVNNGPYTIPPGATSTSVVVTITQDGTQEPDETFTLQLANAVNATVGAGGTQTVTIQDDDPGSVQFDPAGSNGTAAEGDSGTTSHNYQVVLSTASASPVAVDYTIGGSSTVADRVVTASPATFAPGQTTRTITIQIAGDTTTEASETVVLQLSSVTAGYVIGSPATRTHTIQNDD